MYYFFKIEVQLIYSVVLISGVQHSDSVLHVCVYSFFFSLIGYYKTLSTVSCAIQQVLVGYLFYIVQCVYANPKLLIYPSLTLEVTF